jgi:hypothetical protein
VRSSGISSAIWGESGKSISSGRSSDRSLAAPPPLPAPAGIKEPVCGIWSGIGAGIAHAGTGCDCGCETGEGLGAGEEGTGGAAAAAGAEAGAGGRPSAAGADGVRSMVQPGGSEARNAADESPTAAAVGVGESLPAGAGTLNGGWSA